MIALCPAVIAGAEIAAVRHLSCGERIRKENRYVKGNLGKSS
jgi:hypothetical protein